MKDRFIAVLTALVEEAETCPQDQHEDFILDLVTRLNIALVHAHSGRMCEAVNSLRGNEDAN